MNAYNHATNVTRGGYLYVDTSNESSLREKFRVRNFLAPVYSREGRNEEKEEDTNEIRALAKRGHQYIYSNPSSGEPLTYN